MDSSPLVSPASDKCLWSSLRNRVDVILEDRKRKSASTGVGELEGGGKQFTEDSLLLLRGFDSIASSLSQLTNNLDAALQGTSDLAKQPSLTELLKRQPEQLEDGEEVQPKVKKQCSSHESSDDHDAAVQRENYKSPISVSKDEKMKKAQNLAVSMATKAASIARELRSLRSELCFMQERCGLLEEENRRMRDGFAKGVRPPEEDDLVRLQLEALLAEKSRLANENANLTRENQCLHQLVEYHQLTSQDLSASYEQVIQGMYLDFSSPSVAKVDNESDSHVDIEAPQTPRTDLFGFSSTLDEYSKEQQVDS